MLRNPLVEKEWQDYTDAWERMRSAIACEGPVASIQAAESH